MKSESGFHPVHVNTALGFYSAALKKKNACELLRNCLADVNMVTSELNVRGELWKITCLKMSSVTSAPLEVFLTELLFVCLKTQQSST